MTQGTLSPEEMARARESLSAFARTVRARRREATRQAMLKAVRDSNRPKTFTIDSLTTIAKAVGGGAWMPVGFEDAFEGASEAIGKLADALGRPVEIRPTGRGERKRAGATRRRMERLRARKRRI